MSILNIEKRTMEEDDYTNKPYNYFLGLTFTILWLMMF